MSSCRPVGDGEGIPERSADGWHPDLVHCEDATRLESTVTRKSRDRHRVGGGPSYGFLILPA